MSHLFHPYTSFSAIQTGNFPHIVRGEGIYLFDDQGNRFVDVVSSWWACALGHNHPQIVQAIPTSRHSPALDHRRHDPPPCYRTRRNLAHLMPTPDRHVVFASDGASAVEAALKIAVQYWHNIGRPEKERSSAWTKATTATPSAHWALDL